MVPTYDTHFVRTPYLASAYMSTKMLLQNRELKRCCSTDLGFTSGNRTNPLNPWCLPRIDEESGTTIL